MPNNVLHWVYRLEMQARGVVHLHGLAWLLDEATRSQAYSGIHEDAPISARHRIDKVQNGCKKNTTNPIFSPYLAEGFAVTRSTQDCQAAHANSVLEYVVGYATKDSTYATALDSSDEPSLGKMLHRIYRRSKP